MSIFLDDIPSMKMYRTKFYLPINKKDRKEGSAIFLLTKDMDKSIDLIHHPMMINIKSFISYYLERDVMFYINEMMDLIPPLRPLNESLSKSERDKIDDNEFGIPEDRKYPLDTAQHVRSAIKLFGHAEEDKKKKLAKRISKAANHYGIQIKSSSEVYRYLNESNADMTYYVGDDKILPRILPGCPNMDSSNPRWITYLWASEKLAGEFALQKAVRNALFRLDPAHTLSRPVYDFKAHRFCLIDSEYNRIKKLCKGTPYYIFITTTHLTASDKLPKGYFICSTYPTIMGQNNYTVQNIEFNQTFDKVTAGEYAKLKKQYHKNKDELNLLINDDDELAQANKIKAGKSKDKHLTPKGIPNTIKLVDFEAPKSGVVHEEVDILNEEIDIPEVKSRIGVAINESSILEDGFIANVDGDKFRVIYDEAVDAILENAHSNPKLRKLLFRDRIINQKTQMELYAYIKDKCTEIAKTYVNLSMYKGKNLFIDTSYYLKAFFKNNMYRLDTGLDLLANMISKSIHDSRLAEYGYIKKTAFVNVHDWAADEANVWNYKDNPNPMNIIFRYIKRGDIDKLVEVFGADTKWVFMSNQAYFTVNFTEFDKISLTKFILLINKLLKEDIGDAVNDTRDSSDVLVTKVADRLDASGIEIRNITGGTSKLDPKQVNDVISYNTKEPADAEERKAFLVNQVKKAADAATTEDEVYQNLDTDDNKAWLAGIIDDIKSDESINISATRAARISRLRDDLLNKKLEGKSIKDYISDAKGKPIPTDNIPIDNLNEEWNDIKFTNFSKAYNIDDDVVSIFTSMIDKTEPMSIVSIDKKDVSTINDYIEEWDVKFEDANGKRHNIKVDMPKFIDNRFMKLRGNLKTIQGQLLLLPIIKTNEDTCQIVSNYNKIFIYRINPSNGSKTTYAVSKLTKILKKYNGSTFTAQPGDNSFVCSKHTVPVEYNDLAGLYSKITFKDGSFISFNLDDMKELAKEKLGKKYEEDAIYLCYDKVNDTVMAYDKYVAGACLNIMRDEATHYGDEDLIKLLDSTKGSTKCSYTSASIMNSDIPVIVVMAFSEGLQSAMKKGGVKYDFTEKRPTGPNIKFKDGYIVYDSSIESSLLMTGLTKCDTEFYSIKDIDKREMWIDFLENFGGRIKADGLDNFYDLMIDPITKEVCEIYHLPTDYIEILGYASSLLADTKYNKHVDISGNRIRTNEIVAGYLYKAIANAYGDYKNQLKRNKAGASFSVKKSAVIDSLLTDPTASDLSVLSPELEAEAANALSFKGLSGMNSDRSYTLDKRIYDDSMLGILGMSTGFAGNVGITRQATINASVANTRGIIEKPKDLNTLNMLSVHEALTPFCTTHDDPMRIAMGFIQSSKHQMRVKRSSPNLVTTGMDEALPYITSNIFSHKFKGKKGKVIDVSDEWIVYEDSDTRERQYVSLKENVMKNSDGGFFVTVKLSPNVHKGQVLHMNDILAYDKTSYSKAIGTDTSEKTISYNSGTLAKIGVIPTDEAYEDSAIITDSLADSLTTEYLVKKDRYLPKDTNVYSVVAPGTPIREGDPLLIFQNAFEEKDANALLKAITDDDLDAVSDLGRIQVRSKLTGVVQDVKIYRTCELDELSPSLRKLVTAYEKKIKQDRTKLKKLGIENANAYLGADYKLEPEGNLKGAPDGIMIEFYLKCTDKMGIGDKLIYSSALKGVIKKVIRKGDEPTTPFRPNEHIEALLTTSGVNARMVSSIIINGLINKILIETTRQCQEKLGIKWRNLYEIEANEDK